MTGYKQQQNEQIENTEITSDIKAQPLWPMCFRQSPV